MNLRRRLLNLLTVVSLLLCVALIALLVASRSRPVSCVCRESSRSAMLTGVHGAGVYVLTLSSPGPGWRGSAPSILDDWTADLGGFKFGPELPPTYWPGSPSFVIVPFWFLLLVFGACAVACFLLRRRLDGRGALPPGGFQVAEESEVREVQQ